MLAPTLVQLVKQLLADGQLSHRQIARALDLSRSTVLAIAKGRRPEKQRAAKPKPKPVDDDVTGPVGWCPVCGATVMMPCLACHLRKRFEQDQAAPPTAGPEEPLELELSEKHRRRYEAVVARRAKSNLALEAKMKSRRTRAEVRRKRFRPVCQTTPRRLQVHDRVSSADPSGPPHPSLRRFAS
ncbi:MAG: winged helix-turn-helix domain-containing protein [Pirellulales bacterium]|nr:winged helix-turn-helix domain-containing protein [Pirellulales bacterium]